MKTFLTVREACSPEHLDRSPNWIRAAIRVGKVKAEKAGNILLINRLEIERLRINMPTISAKEMENIHA